MAGVQPPFSAEALNRYRLTHNDREYRPLIRRLNKAPAAEGQEDGDAELLHLDVEKWRLHVDRLMASARSMERQKREYERKKDETVSQTNALREKLAEETALLHAKQTERARRMKCDEVARKIQARGKTRVELDAEIASLQALIVDHRSSYEAVLGVAQQRADSFGRIAALVDECRGLKLALSEEDAAAEKLVEQAEKELKAEKAGKVAEKGERAERGERGDRAERGDRGERAERAERERAEKTKLSAQTLPFQPSAALSAPTSRQHSASPGPGPAHGVHGGHAHPLPARPVRSGRRGAATHAHAPHSASGLPPRPVSGLRNVRHMHGPPGLEDGELGEDDGAGQKRKADEQSGPHGSQGRSTRRK